MLGRITLPGWLATERLIPFGSGQPVRVIRPVPMLVDVSLSARVLGRAVAGQLGRRLAMSANDFAIEQTLPLKGDGYLALERFLTPGFRSF